MRSLLFVLLGLMCISLSASGRTNFQKAKEEAAKDHKLMLLTFSGSDWCGPCRKLERDIFSKDTFRNFAANNLVMINADFPRKKELDAETVKQNRQLAAKYHRQKVFPYTVLLNAEGQVLAEWRGYPGVSPEVFISQVSEFIQPGTEKPDIAQKAQTNEMTTLIDSSKVENKAIQPVTEEAAAVENVNAGDE